MAGGNPVIFFKTGKSKRAKGKDVLCFFILLQRKKLPAARYAAEQFQREGKGRNASHDDFHPEKYIPLTITILFPQADIEDISGAMIRI